MPADRCPRHFEDRRQLPGRQADRRRQRRAWRTPRIRTHGHARAPRPSSPPGVAARPEGCVLEEHGDSGRNGVPAPTAHHDLREQVARRFARATEDPARWPAARSPLLHCLSVELGLLRRSPDAPSACFMTMRIAEKLNPAARRRDSPSAHASGPGGHAQSSRPRSAARPQRAKGTRFNES